MEILVEDPESSLFTRGIETKREREVSESWEAEVWWHLLWRLQNTRIGKLVLCISDDSSTSPSELR